MRQTLQSLLYGVGTSAAAPAMLVSHGTLVRLGKARRIVGGIRGGGEVSLHTEVTYPPTFTGMETMYRYR